MKKIVLCLLILTSAVACKRKTTGSGSTVTSENNVTDVKKIVSVGAGLNFNASTGSWSEMAINPITHMPEVLYYDRTAVVSPVAGALKFAGMTASGSWKIEVIDNNSPVTAITNTCGGGATSANCIGAPNVAVPTTSQPQIYDIKHLVTDGIASTVVAYVYGTGGAAASISGKTIRFASRNASGKWSVETAVTGAQIVAATIDAVGPQRATLEYPIKGLRLLVDDSQRIHMLFAVYAATPNNSVYLYTMRTATGQWLAPTAVTTSSPSTLAFVSGGPTYVATSGVAQTGAAWCRYNSGGSSADATGIVVSLAALDNSPTTSLQPFLLKCSSANTDGSCATWQGLDLVTGCSGACVTTTPALTSTTVNQGTRSDLTIDPATGKIFLSYYSAAPTMTSPAAIATGILSTLSPLACDGGLTTTAWPTTRAHPTALQGTLGLRVAADGTNFYLSSMTAATGTSVVLNKQNSSLGANWNTSPDQLTVDAVTSMVGGGFSYDASTNVLWGSYGALTATAAGAVGQDIKAFGVYPSDIDSTTGPVNNWYIDQTNHVAQVSAVPMLDADVAPNGLVGYVYFYQEPGTAGPNSHLYYGIRGGTPLNPVFGEKLVSNSIAGATTFTNGLHPSLSYDSASNPVISFLDQGTAANSGYLMMARSSNGGVSFDLDRVDGSNTTTRKVGQYTSVDVSSNDTIGVAYYDFSTGTTGQRLKFAKRQKNGAWLRYVVDGPESTGTGCDTTTNASIGVYAQFRWTSTGRPVIVYQGSVSGVKSLKLAYASESESSTTYTWSCLTIDNNGQASNERGEGIDFDLDSSDKPYIAHYESTVGALRMVTCSSDILSCALGGSSTFSGERLNYIIGTINPIASRPGIRVDPTGKVWVSYHGPGDMGLFVVSRSVAGEWDPIVQVIETAPTNVSASYTGHHGVLLLNSNHLPMLFYRGFENWIKYFSREP